MSLIGNICKNALFQGLQRIFGVVAAKFAVVALVLLVGAGCNLQVRQTERAGLRKIPAVIVETVHSEDSQAASSKAVVNIEGAGTEDVAKVHIAEQGLRGEPAGPKDGLKVSEPEQILSDEPDEEEAKEDSPSQIKAAPASIEESPAKFASLPLSLFRLRNSTLWDNDVDTRPVLASLTTPAGETKVSNLPSAEGSAGKEPEPASTSTESPPDPDGAGELPDLSGSPAEQGQAEVAADSVIEESRPGPEEGGEGEATGPGLATAAGGIGAEEVEVKEKVPGHTESEPSVAVLTSAVTVGVSQETQAEKSQDEAATGKPAAEKPAGRAGEESSASEAAAEVKDSDPEAKTEEEAAGDDGGGDATAEAPPFPKGYLIVLVVCLALAVFKNTVGKI